MTWQLYHRGQWRQGPCRDSKETEGAKVAAGEVWGEAPGKTRAALLVHFCGEHWKEELLSSSKRWPGRSQGSFTRTFRAYRLPILLLGDGERLGGGGLQGVAVTPPFAPPAGGAWARSSPAAFSPRMTNGGRTWSRARWRLARTLRETPWWVRKMRGGAQSSAQPGTWEAGPRVGWRIALRAGFSPTCAARKEWGGGSRPGASSRHPGAPPERAGRQPGFVSGTSVLATSSSLGCSKSPDSRVQSSGVSEPPPASQPKMTISCSHPCLRWENQTGPSSLLVPPPPPQKIKVFSKEGTTAFGVFLTLTCEEKEEYKFGAQRTGTLCHKYKHYLGSSLDF